MSGVRYPFGTDYGLEIDEDGQFDVDTTFAIVTDIGRVLLADLLKIVTTISGTLWWAPTATEDATQLLNDAISPERLAAARHRLQSAIEQDPRFEDVSVTTKHNKHNLQIFIQTSTINHTLHLILIMNKNKTLNIKKKTINKKIL